MSKAVWTKVFTLLLLLMPLSLGSCELECETNQSPVEEAADELEDAAEEAGDAIADASEN